MNATMPSYRQYLLLGPGPGWRATTVGLTSDAVAYSLDALPGGAVAWPPIPGAAPASPIAFASGKDRGSSFSTAPICGSRRRSGWKTAGA